MSRKKLKGMAKEFKRGRLSQEEVEYMRGHAQQQTGEEIGVAINRDPRMVRKWIVENCDVVPEMQPAEEEDAATARLKRVFRRTPEYEHLTAELDSKDLRFFEHRFVKLMTQFSKDEILPTEEAQLLQLIKFELLAHRAMEDKKKAQSEIDRFNLTISRLQRLCEFDEAALSEKDSKLLTACIHALAGVKQDKADALKQHNDLLSKHAAILKDLKATREQRISKIISNNITFTDVIQQLQEEEVREREGKQIAMMQAAAQQALNKLSQGHVYLDKMVDQPILNHETV